MEAIFIRAIESQGKVRKHTVEVYQVDSPTPKNGTRQTKKNEHFIVPTVLKPSDMDEELSITIRKFIKGFEHRVILLENIAKTRNNWG